MAVISLDMYNDASRLIDSNFDGEYITTLRWKLTLRRLRSLHTRTACKDFVQQRREYEIFADPRLTDYELLLSNLKDLRQGKTTKVNLFWPWLTPK